MSLVDVTYTLARVENRLFVLLISWVAIQLNMTKALIWLQLTTLKNKIIHCALWNFTLCKIHFLLQIFCSEGNRMFQYIFFTLLLFFYLYVKWLFNETFWRSDFITRYCKVLKTNENGNCNLIVKKLIKTYFMLSLNIYAVD